MFRLKCICPCENRWALKQSRCTSMIQYPMTVELLLTCAPLQSLDKYQRPVCIIHFSQYEKNQKKCVLSFEQHFFFQILLKELPSNL